VEKAENEKDIILKCPLYVRCIIAIYFFYSFVPVKQSINQTHKLMPKRKCKAALNLKRTDYDGVNNQAGRIEKGMYGRPDLYVTPPITNGDFSTMYKTSILSTSAAKTGGPTAKTTRNIDNGVLYDAMEDQLIPYINGLYTDNKENIEAAGVDAVDETEPQGVPEKVGVKEVVKGTDPHTVKVVPTRLGGSKKLKRSIKYFTVYVYDDPNLETPVSKVQFTNSRKLIITNVVFAKAFWYALQASNASGDSELSGRTKFTLNDN